MSGLNFLSLPSLVEYADRVEFDETAPLVSILVPARNEAANIEKCVASLLAQDYPNFEILVLDDNSEDTTPALVTRLIAENPTCRLSLLHGEALPDGWYGKNFACHQLAQAAKGAFLLFTDADTSHQPIALRAAVAALQLEKAHFLSVFPRQETVTFAERLVLPLLLVYIYGLLPTWLVSRNLAPAFSAASGQFILFERRAYDTIGGHAAVRKEVLEDVRLGQRIKQFGFRQLLPDGREAVTCRMYRNRGEVWRGFSKNLFAFFNYKISWLALFLGVNLLGFVGPYVWLGLGWLTAASMNIEWFWLPLGQVGLALILRGWLALRYGFKLVDIFLYPLSILFMTAIALNSVSWRYRATEWKGRKYRINSSK